MDNSKDSEKKQRDHPLEELATALTYVLVVPVNLGGFGGSVGRSKPYNIISLTLTSAFPS